MKNERDGVYGMWKERGWGIIREERSTHLALH